MKAEHKILEDFNAACAQMSINLTDVIHTFISRDDANICHAVPPAPVVITDIDEWWNMKVDYDETMFDRYKKIAKIAKQKNEATFTKMFRQGETLVTDHPEFSIRFGKDCDRRWKKAKSGNETLDEYKKLIPQPPFYAKDILERQEGYKDLVRVVEEARLKMDIWIVPDEDTSIKQDKPAYQFAFIFYTDDQSPILDRLPKPRMN